MSGGYFREPKKSPEVFEGCCGEPETSAGAFDGCCGEPEMSPEAFVVTKPPRERWSCVRLALIS